MTGTFGSFQKYIETNGGWLSNVRWIAQISVEARVEFPSYLNSTFPPETDTTRLKTNKEPLQP